MSLSDEERRSIVNYRIEKANIALEDVKQMANLQRWSAAANRLYYSVYYAATALLINSGHASRTHSGMITQISVHFVLPGLLTKDDGRLIRKLFDLRQEADYDDFIDATEDDINEYLPQVETFVQKIVLMIDAQT